MYYADDRPSHRGLLLLMLLGGGAYAAYRMGYLNTVGQEAVAVWDQVTDGGDVSVVTPATPNATVAPSQPITVASVIASVTSALSGGLPRGIRNNNPLNIVYSAGNAWQGQTGSDGTFAVFDNAEDGIRAAFVLLKTYIDGYGLGTLSAIISRWAPAPANNPAAYAASVSLYAGIPVSASVSTGNSAQMIAIFRGMCAVENGASYAGYYSDAVCQAAFARS